MYNEDNTDPTFGLDRIDDKLLNFEESLPTAPEQPNIENPEGV